MKRTIYIVCLLISLIACGKKIPAGAKTDTFKVWGNCGMCKKTIEKSLKVEGVFQSNWDKKTKMITVAYEPSKISLDQIQKRIADAGYDNEGYTADSASYESLHSCCKYERTKINPIETK
jgi:periplasmic mercuric ion binding protein